jgi:hypothetical protein
MAVDLDDFLVYEGSRVGWLWITTFTVRDGTRRQRLPRAAVPQRIRELLRDGVDFSVTRNP